MSQQARSKKWRLSSAPLRKVERRARTDSRRCAKSLAQRPGRKLKGGGWHAALAAGLADISGVVRTPQVIVTITFSRLIGGRDTDSPACATNPFCSNHSRLNSRD